jgi:hypothetical protein
MKILSAAELKKAMKDPLIGAIMAQRQVYVNMFWDYWSRPNKDSDIGYEIKAKATDGTMTLLQAYNTAKSNKQVVQVEFHDFAMLGWKSPESGKTSGPFMFTVWLGVAVEIGENGRFKDMVPAGAEGYFLWMEDKK